MPLKILSLSGGGVRGIFQAAYLCEIGKHLSGKPVGEHFDVIAGTSTGAIIALGVAIGVEPKAIVDFFRSYGPRIFRRRWAWYVSLGKGPQYSNKLLRHALLQLFGTKKLGECKKDIIIAATTLDRFRSRVFTTLEDNGDSELLAVDVAMASSAAPMFFSPMQPSGQARTYVDGGLWANTPSLLAVTQVHESLRVPFEDMRLVTVGNGEVPSGTVPTEFGSLRAVNPTLYSCLFDIMFSTQSQMSDQVAQSLIGTENTLRINVQLDKFISLDDVATAIKRLPALAEETALQTADQLKDFLSTPIASDPKGDLIDDVLRSLRKFAYIGSTKDDSLLRKRLSTGNYIRSQNLYELIRKGLLTVKSQFLFINDHPFKPFTDLVLQNIVATANYIGINAAPDALYSKFDVDRRIQLVEAKGTEIQYYLLPKEDVHLSLLIFDQRAVLVYPTPLGRSVCNFSEALIYTDVNAVDEWIRIFQHIQAIAIRYMQEYKIDPIQELKKFGDFYAI